LNELRNLRQLDLFSDLKPNTIEQILRIITVRHFESGEYIFRPGDPCDRLYLLHHGRVKTHVYSNSGQEKIMHIFHPGDAFGGLLLSTTHGTSICVPIGSSIEHKMRFWQRLDMVSQLTTVSRYMKHLMWKMDLNPLVIPNGIPAMLLKPVNG